MHMAADHQPERRSANRQKVYLGAKVSTGVHFEPLDCVVRNLTADGAYMVLSGNARLPDTFRLAIPAKECILHARIVWRAGGSFGVYFDGFEFGAIAAAPVTPAGGGARGSH